MNLPVVQQRGHALQAFRITDRDFTGIRGDPVGSPVAIDVRPDGGVVPESVFTR